MTSMKRKPKNLSSDKKKKGTGVVKVRRFEMGVSSVYFFDFLESCGYSIHSANGHRYGLRKGKVGRFSNVSREEVMQLVDELRKRRGLQPFKKV